MGSKPGTPAVVWSCDCEGPRKELKGPGLRAIISPVPANPEHYCKLSLLQSELLPARSLALAHDQAFHFAVVLHSPTSSYWKRKKSTKK